MSSFHITNSTVPTTNSQSTLNLFNGSDEVATYLKNKERLKKSAQKSIIHNKTIREETIPGANNTGTLSANSNNSNTGTNDSHHAPLPKVQTGNAHAPQISHDINDLLNFFRESHDVLDMVLAVMLLSANNAADTMERQSDSFAELTQASNDLKKAADGMKEYNDWLASRTKNGSTHQVTQDDLDSMNADENNPSLASFKNALIEFGGLNPNGNNSPEDIKNAMEKMGQFLQGDMQKIQPSSLTAGTALEADTKAMMAAQDDGTKDPSQAVTDYLTQLNSSSGAGTSMSQTLSAQLQGVTNNYQMLFGMATSLLQRTQDLNQKITSLT